MIAIIDTGGANIASVVNALERLGKKSVLTEDPQVIKTAPHVILPGVGSAADSMERLREKGLVQLIRELKQPTFGICLGMQLLFSYSDEGETDCLDIIPGSVQPLDPGSGYAIPHMGWNQLKAVERTRLLSGIPEGSPFYFVHSYVAPLGPWVRGTTCHGVEFPALVERNNFFGAQFHPERSSEMGAKMLENFLNL